MVPGKFLSDRITVRTGSPQAIPLRLENRAASTARLDVLVALGELQLLANPEIDQGGDLGFVRVLASRPGESILRSGDSTLRISAVEPLTKTSPADVLSIVTPLPGAAVWRPFSIGVEAFDPKFDSQLDGAEVRLRLPDRSLILASEESKPDNGPVRSMRFEIDPSNFNEGPMKLVAVARCPDGNFVESDPLMLTVVRPDDSARFQGECEDYLFPATTERGIDRFGDKPAKVNKGEKDDPASISNKGPKPAWNLPVDITKPGDYQLALRVKSTYAGGYASLGLYVNEGDKPVTSSRVAGEGWHWVPIGKPVALKQGKQMLTPFFTNDFNAQKMDRNLALDQFDLILVSGATATPETAPTDGSPMMAEATMAPAPAMNSMAMMDASGEAADSSKIGILPPMNGQVITTRTSFQVLASGDKKAPTVEMLINGESVESKKGNEPSFAIEPEMLKKGRNSLQLVVHRVSGATENSDNIPIVGPMDFPDSLPLSVKKGLKYSVTDKRWNEEDMAQVLPPDKRASGQNFAAFMANGTIRLALDDLPAGEFEFLVECRGDEFQGKPKLTMTVAGSDESKSLSLDVDKDWKTRSLGNAEIPAGLKVLDLAFVNDLAEAGKGDRNLYVRGIEIRPTLKDKLPPVASLIYPAENQKIWNADVVIANAVDNRKLRFAEILLDGKATGFRSATVDRQGRLLIPFPLRTVAGGTHTLAVRATDDSGNSFDSAGRKIIVVQNANALSPYARAVRLTQRFGFGPEPAQIIAILLEGERAWFDKQLATPNSEPVEVAARVAAGCKSPRTGSPEEVAQRSIYEFLLTQAPVRTRFTMWAENHFSTWIRKVGALTKWKEHSAFDRTGIAPFLTLLKVSSHSPAMIYYLDQQRSFANKLNENYARELMELHTLGVDGGYTQKDVTTLAKLLNGWMLSDEADPEGMTSEMLRVYRFEPRLADNNPKTILGLDFPAVSPEERYDQISTAIEILAAHPSTAKFISTKLVEHYLGCPAPDAAVKALTDVYIKSSGDMRQMMLALAERPELWDGNLDPKIATPLDYSIRLARLTGSSNAPRVMDFVRKSGMGLYERSTPDGYQEENEDYMNSNALLQRWRLSQASMDQMQNVIPVAETKTSLDAQGTVDFLAMRLTGLPLSQRSNEAALDIANQLSSDKGIDSPTLAAFISQLPETSLR